MVLIINVMMSFIPAILVVKTSNREVDFINEVMTSRLICEQSLMAMWSANRNPEAMWSANRMIGRISEETIRCRYRVHKRKIKIIIIIMEQLCKRTWRKTCLHCQNLDSNKTKKEIVRTMTVSTNKNEKNNEKLPETQIFKNKGLSKEIKTKEGT